MQVASYAPIRVGKCLKVMARELKCLWEIKDGRQFFLGELAAVLELHRIVQYCLIIIENFTFSIASYFV